jgi:glycine cleavage system aminomethyltransferase T
MGFAWVPIERATLGTELAIAAPDGARKATVVPLPFLDPEKAVAKS